MLEVANIVTAYGAIQALKGVSIAAKPGEITCLLGPNGAGKTTLMMTVAGILKPRRGGSIRMEGREIAGADPRKVVRSGIALVPENRLVFQDMTVLDNLRAGAFLRDGAEVSADIERMFLRFPRLKERSEQMAGTLSGGEQQMLAVARALMTRPKLLMMDEPSLGLAPLIVNEIFAIVRDLNRDGVTILLVEQNAHKALEVAHRFYLLEQGKVTFSGTPGQLAEAEVIRRAYLGSAKA